LLDIAHQAPAASRRLLGAGVLAALPAAAAGLSDWIDTDDAEQRVGLVHGFGNLVGIACMAGSWFRRRSGAGGRGLSFTGMVMVSFSGWLGGHLSYAMGVGVDTNAFHTGPDRWTPTTSDHPAHLLSCHDADGARLVVTKLADGTTHAMADRCSHRGGPLSNGELDGDCVTCPWHQSQFDVRSGNVRRGPASVPQPIYEVRAVGSKLEVRREEPRSLRRNPV
jgi:nitrite reductase/ring-hydroxylating ferredoxin subunit